MIPYPPFVPIPDRLTARNEKLPNAPAADMLDPRRGPPAITRKLDIPATLALIGATLCWGVVPIMLKFLARPEYVPDGFTANAVRYPVSAIIYLPWLVWGIRRGQLKGLWLTALIPTAANVCLQTLWAWSPYFLDAGLLAFLLRLCVVWTIIGAFILFKDERPLARSPRFWIGATLAMGGFVAMSGGALWATSGASLAGIAIIFFCGVFWACYTLSVRAVMHDLHPLVVFSVISAYTSIGVLVMAPLGEPASITRIPPIPFAILVLSSVLGIATAHGLYYIAVQRIGAAIGSLMLMVAPLITLFGSYLIFGEAFTPLQWVGGIVLLAGTALAIHAQTLLKTPDKDEAADIPFD